MAELGAAIGCLRLKEQREERMLAAAVQVGVRNALAERGW